jgi:hypothetical protein
MQFTTPQDLASSLDAAVSFLALGSTIRDAITPCMTTYQDRKQGEGLAAHEQKVVRMFVFCIDTLFQGMAVHGIG